MKEFDEKLETASGIMGFPIVDNETKDGIVEPDTYFPAGKHGMVKLSDIIDLCNRVLEKEK